MSEKCRNYWTVRDSTRGNIADLINLKKKKNTTLPHLLPKWNSSDNIEGLDVLQVKNPEMNLVL